MNTTDWVGQTIGQYRIEAPLDAGGMGQVFRGTHANLNRPAAIAPTTGPPMSLHTLTPAANPTAQTNDRNTPNGNNPNGTDTGCNSGTNTGSNSSTNTGSNNRKNNPTNSYQITYVHKCSAARKLHQSR